jgi:hypothetical protein
VVASSEAQDHKRQLNADVNPSIGLRAIRRQLTSH